ncbi:MAG TPA: NAD-dependent epimerase/dehydratase family protein [Verrucomicrobiota bacterium]|jgi:nucleoside-diphosphate-sugar epimerase|nr:NAD-dependent epimerase/dehydratase family protein [Verrucomicrobiota bacterium]HRT08148.1 NAD-dependent epimerase/dehydratase family protein [Candidatus Paceibacterota bacterium]HRT57658.1 NAD-dependent epimerase/dehydratase family protein [Candidatus Paceibacterota bacterium]
MTILFLGGTGNISTECAALLHRRGHQIVILSRGKSPVPPEYRAVVADRKDPDSLRRAVAGLKVDVVANFIGYEVGDLETDYSVWRGAIGQYVFISSATVYAKPAPRLPIAEDSPLGNAWWDYAQKKLACEEWLRCLPPGSEFPWTIVRPSHTYSKRWIPNVVSSSTYTVAARLEQGRPVFVPDDGENPWTLTAASDFAVGFAGLVGNPRALGEAFHITSDEVLTWNQIYARIAEAVGAPAPVIERIPTDFICEIAPHLTGTLKGDKAHPGIFDNSKIKRLVPDFTCRKPFAEGIREAVAWLRAHPEQQNLNPQVDRTIDDVIKAWKKRAAP